MKGKIKCYFDLEDGERSLGSVLELDQQVEPQLVEVCWDRSSR